MAIEGKYASRLGAFVVGLMLTIGGCGGGDEDSPPSFGGVPPPPVSAPSPDPGDTIVDTQISGSVGDGPVVGASIEIRAQNGSLLDTLASDSKADYEIVLRTQSRNFPLTITATGGTDLVTGHAADFALRTVILAPGAQVTGNLNPFTSLVHGIASRNGGLTDAAVAQARDRVLHHYGFGLDPATFHDPSGTMVNESNVHLVVKASETLGEMVRRTRDALLASGRTLDPDAIVDALAADLADGHLDGIGAGGSDQRVAAVANVATASVLVEAMANRLHVNGVDATLAMDMAIRQVRPDAPAGATTANVPIPAEAIDQALRSLRAAEQISADPTIVAAIAFLTSALPGSLPADFAPHLPSSLAEALSAAITATAFASDATVRAINTAARGDAEGGTEPPPAEPPPAEPPPTEPPPKKPPPEEPPPEEPPPAEPPPEEPPPEEPPPPNNPPVISGSPNTSLVVGTPWSFTPTAWDPDGDSLTFSVSGRPSWMSFDRSNGRLSGTPSSADVGIYDGIVLSVSDGMATSSLPPFTMTVSEPAPSTGSATISWTPPTTYSDGSALNSINAFRIHYGISATQLDQVVSVSGGLTTYQIDNLESGTWYFAVSAVDAMGLESVRSSPVVSKTIP